MITNRSRMGIIFLTIFIDLVGFGILIPVLPLYSKHLGATPWAYGILVAIYSAMQFVFSPLWGKLSDRIGRRPVLLISVFGTAVGFFVMGMAQTLAWLFVARIIDGISGGNISTAQAYIADITEPENRSKAMGFIGAAFGLGFIFGPAIGGWLGGYSMAAPFYFAAVLALVNFCLIFFRLPESLDEEHRSHRQPRKTIGDVFRHANGKELATVIATYFLSICGFAIMTTIYPLFTEARFGYGTRETGYIFALIGVLGVILQGGLLGRLVKKFGEKNLATTGAFVLAAMLFCLPLSTTLAVLLLISAGIAIGNGLITPTLNGLASKHVDKSWQGRAMGLMQSAGSLGRTIGPLLAGWLLTSDVGKFHFGRTPLWTGAIIMVAAFVTTLSLSRPSEATDSIPTAAKA